MHRAGVAQLAHAGHVGLVRLEPVAPVHERHVAGDAFRQCDGRFQRGVVATVDHHLFAGKGIEAFGVVDQLRALEALDPLDGDTLRLESADPARDNHCLGNENRAS